MYLHVAALPFPTRQGTQAVIRQMLEAETADGRAAHLLTYSESGYPLSPTFSLHRVPAFPRLPTQRSGPSGAKVLLDLRMTCSLRRCVQRLRPQMLVAHHVEAAAVCLSATRLPVLFFAHTDLGAELPGYAPPALSGPLRWAGAALDRWLLRRAHAIATISPALADQLQRQESRAAERIAFVPPPWQQPVDRAPERLAARTALGLSPTASWLLYAGNLDAYQGWESLLEAQVRLRQDGLDARLLVATDSDPAPLLRRARRAGLAEQVKLAPLSGERMRALVHAAADLALVPRKAPGGLPIKLLDAMARGLPAVVAPRATAGLSLDRVCEIAREDSGEALAVAAKRVLDSDRLRHRLALAGPAHVARWHSGSTYLQALDAACKRALHASPHRA